MNWARILIPVFLGLAVAAGGAATTSLVRDAETRATVRQLDTAGASASQERQRLAAEAREAERAAAAERSRQDQRWGEVSAALARIEARLEGLEERRRPRRREGTR